MLRPSPPGLRVLCTGCRIGFATPLRARVISQLAISCCVLSRDFTALPRACVQPIEVAKLCKAKYQDNLEFLQWMKGYHERTSGGGEYDATGRRTGSKGVKSASAGPRPQRAAAAADAPDADRQPLQRKRANAPTSRRPAGKTASGTAPPPLRSPHDVCANIRPPAVICCWDSAAEAKVGELKGENMELKLAVDGLERERDFYFGKLRDIEIMCQSPDPSVSMEDFVAQVTKIL